MIWNETIIDELKSADPPRAYRRERSYQHHRPNGRRRLPFGKFAGSHLKDIPDDYLRWLRTIYVYDFRLSEDIDVECERRQHWDTNYGDFMEEDYPIIDIDDLDGCFLLRVQLEELLKQPSRAVELPMDEVKALLFQLPAVQIALAASLIDSRNLLEPDKQDHISPQPNEDEWLTRDQAAKLLNVNPHWLSGRKLPFSKRIGHRTVRYSKLGLLRWRTTRRPD